ncbi:MAG: RNA polymerase factor sigma-54, partial [Bacteroidaceae bacterium]|nr:RNA polymerase factor sigma-54 [Bacteroidaceae bacterium]
IQKQQQLQRLSPQQLLTVKLLELPIAELAENVKNEIVDNVALEEGPLKGGDECVEDEFGGSSVDGERTDEMQTDEYEAPETMYEYDADDIPSNQEKADYSQMQEIPIGATKSFMDDMMEQMVNYDLSEEQYVLVEYLIYSLDNRGFLSRPIPSLVDDMIINHNIYTDEDEVEKALHILQQFDPPGIAARDTRECLLLQIDRILKDANSQTFEKIELLQDSRKIIDEHYDLFINNNLEKLQNITGMSAVHLSDVLDTIKKLNLHPGLALSESSGDRVQLAVPDFIIETDADGEVNFSLNGGDVPSLHVSQEYVQMLSMMQKPGVKLSKHDKERFSYYQQKVDSARMYIESIKQRHHTLESTMKAIIDLQHQFFITQNEDDLQKLILENVATKAGLDVSTVSRVCNSKYALVDGTLYPLSFFFKRMRTNSKGEEIDGNKVEKVLKDIIDQEDKKKPYSDVELVEQLKKRGINIERRTVNKYRAKFGIPTAIKRKSI